VEALRRRRVASGSRGSAPARRRAGSPDASQNPLTRSDNIALGVAPGPDAKTEKIKDLTVKVTVFGSATWAS